MRKNANLVWTLVSRLFFVVADSIFYAIVEVGLFLQSLLSSIPAQVTGRLSQAIKVVFQQICGLGFLAATCGVLGILFHLRVVEHRGEDVLILVWNLVGIGHDVLATRSHGGRTVNAHYSASPGGGVVR